MSYLCIHIDNVIFLDFRIYIELSRKDKYVGISRWGASSSFRRVERDETLAVE